MKRILVTGASGQLGLSIQKVHKKYTDLDFVFMNSKELDITNLKMVQEIFGSGHFDFVLIAPPIPMWTKQRRPLKGRLK